jgi:predicted phosphodiesterase
MKYALISDIHANLPALEAVLNDIKMQNCSNVACLGDIVGYYNEPKACVGIIRDMKIPCVRGNFDEYCSSQTPLTDFNSKVAATIEWTRQQLNDEERAWLRGLPDVLTIAGFTIVHSTMDEPRRWEYVFDKFAAQRSFVAQRTPVCFSGHTHVPVALFETLPFVEAPTRNSK